MHNNLEKNILSTICYYDIMNYPLTVFEIWKHLLAVEDDRDRGFFEKAKIADVLTKLKEDNLKKFIETKDGFYFLRGRHDLVQNRIRSNKISVSKIKKMRRVVRILRIAPFVRMILVTGRLAMKNAKPKSDWDVLVVLRENRIWLGRTCITLLAHILGKRRHHDKIKDRICFNYFITTNSLEIRNKDLFSANEYNFCFPLFEVKNYFNKFQLRNIWIRKHKPNFYLAESRNLFSLSDNKWTLFLRTFFENLLDHNFLESYLEKLELKKIKNNPKTSNVDGLIDTDKRALIFLPHPQGPRVFEKFKKRLGEFNFYQ